MTGISGKIYRQSWKLSFEDGKRPFRFSYFSVLIGDTGLNCCQTKGKAHGHALRSSS